MTDAPLTLVTLSGWGQSPESLIPLARVLPGVTVHPLDYLSLPDVEAAMAELAALQPDIILGWSLGGQLACEAVLQRIISPKALLLLSTAWQFCADAQLPDAMPLQEFKSFSSHFQHNPAKTLRHFQRLMLQGDMQADAIRPQLTPSEAGAEQLAYWLAQLPHLGGAGEGQDISWPPMLSVHGACDAIVPASQLRYFARMGAQTHSLPGCGHVPHRHDLAEVVTRCRDCITSLLSEDCQPYAAA